MTSLDSPQTNSSTRWSDPSWQVPAFRTVFAAERRHPCCVVIPVLNEGARIQHLLERCHRINIHLVADIIIIDGGSTDGSLAPDFIQPLGVSALLLKTGPGKLGGQLRCAYAFALDKGYDGIITIDGNDKDDPCSIPQFIEALQSGVDFVQASRFLKGSIQRNTPTSRLLAIKLIHAPLLSLTSGFHWTDTTQGFRAYSRKLLLDPRLAVFRDVLSHYELLFYLSYMAPRLGFRCIELPTVREYPEGEVPTKIHGLAGQFKVLRELFRVCLGRYNPPA